MRYSSIASVLNWNLELSGIRAAFFQLAFMVPHRLYSWLAEFAPGSVYRVLRRYRKFTRRCRSIRGNDEGGHENSADGILLIITRNYRLAVNSGGTGITPATDITISSPGGKVYTALRHTQRTLIHTLTRARPVLLCLRLLTLYWISRGSYQVCSTLVNPLKAKWNLNGVGGSIKVD